MNDHLRKAAVGARTNAYAPYSRFKVGAAVETEDGQIFDGANVENAAYPQSMCAERIAIFKAVSSGHTKIVRVYVIADPAASPCGGCRSVMAEFGTPSTEVIIANPAGLEESYSLGDLLPHSFEMKRKTGP